MCRKERWWVKYSHMCMSFENDSMASMNWAVKEKVLLWKFIGETGFLFDWVFFRKCCAGFTWRCIRIFGARDWLQSWWSRESKPSLMRNETDEWRRWKVLPTADNSAFHVCVTFGVRNAFSIASRHGQRVVYYLRNSGTGIIYAGDIEAQGEHPVVDLSLIHISEPTRPY